MGRGRAKAKQAKVARQLKYNIPDMDLDQLQRELKGNSSDHENYGADDYDDDYDKWSDWADEAPQR
ncbi:DUF3073 domain-containing protein [Corynebacterium choanae]|uniref:DUF3073 domain-containing protein n=1 Tax=Corynebacterium choanae TaxID=1862358 RepID=A0A3G6J8P2_9CORY|nr:DUF3073 domain-containing protein [Corynebacterium choanae]AZA12820.1 hypothetical protein CCHOA_01965 [Corynebacterium choanae]